MNLKIFTDNIEGDALNQVYTISKHPAFTDAKIRIMPDVHAGKGCVIGFTATIGDKIIPNLVGSDIGCGILTVCLGKIDLDLEKLDKVISTNIPSGRSVHRNQHMVKLSDLRCYPHLKSHEGELLRRSMGTLGGGNHFIEVDIDDDYNKYLVIHTGSRNLGKKVAEFYQALATGNMASKADLLRIQNQLIEEYKASGRHNELSDALEKLKRDLSPSSKIPKELSYLEGDDREDYLHDMKICQNFASDNRKEIALTILFNMGIAANYAFKDDIWLETVHNYIDPETRIIRKGAISANKGERVLIPMNMRDGCIIGIGKGNEDWNCSAPHGAGRLFSRSAAKELISLEEYRKSMINVYTSSVCASTVDESPMAYKPMAEIVEKIADTIEIEKKITPIYNYKALD